MPYPLKKLSEIAFIKSGKRLPKGQKVLDEDTGFPYIRVSDFNDEGSIDIKNLKYISEENHNNISQYVITDQDLYISIAGTIGKTGIIPENLNGANLTENAVRLVYKDISQIFNRYIYYFTTSKSFIEQAGLATRVVAMPKLAISRLKEITVMVPPLPTQKAIVQKLDMAFTQIDASIELVQKSLKEIEEMEKSVLEEVFGDRGYEEMKLGKVISIKHGYAFKGEFFNDMGNYLLLTPGNFGKNNGLQLRGKKDKYFIGDFPEEYLLNKGDLLIAMTDLSSTAPILGAPGFINADNMLHNQRLGLINEKIKINKEYLFYFFQSDSYRYEVKKYATGTTVKHTSPKRIYDISIPLPPLEKQKEIVEYLDGVFEKNTELKELYEVKLRDLREMKQSLLREAFEGRLVSE